MNINASSDMLGKRYLVADKLGQGGMGTVYQALDRLTGQHVALKRVTAPTESLVFSGHERSESTSAVRLALANEFQVLASLRHPNIISVLDYGFDSNRQPYFTMDLLSNAQTLVVAGKDKPPGVRIEWLIRILQALAYLHRRGILHHDLKPSNVLVAGDEIKILDFGLSVVRNQDPGIAGGTVAYMSPELLQGETIDQRADLYAFGAIAYELLTGTHPFDVADFGHLLKQIVNDTPDYTVIDNVVQGLGKVLGRLLNKKPEDRYSEANQVIDEINATLSQPIIIPTSTFRESFLQAADFIGRDAEMRQLLPPLREVRAGKGSSWLIAGESGIGKSRLLNEWRSRALIEGVAVLRGEAVSEASRPYRLWRESLQWLTLIVDLTDYEIGVLKPVVPEIEGLVGRGVVPDAPELDPHTAQDRLLTVIEHIFQRVEQPIAVILEDIHWAGSESLEVLKRLNRNLAHLPIVVLASFRDDETPTLPQSFPDMNVLKVSRLAEASIANLCESMIGPVGKGTKVTELLTRETEGNVFFLVEMVRALAEDIVDIEKIGTESLSKKIFAGGIAQIVHRRLSRVPLADRPLLEIAAVAGRELDLPVLRAAAPDMDITQWLQSCADVAVLGIESGRWHFTHDKLRQGLLTELAPERRVKLHALLGRAYENVYSDTAEYNGILAYHWAQAGDLAKEAHYSALAGKQTLEQGAFKEALTLLERAFTLRQGDSQPRQRFELAQIKQQIGNAYMGLGQLTQVANSIGEALQYLGKPDFADQGKLRVDLFPQLGRQILNRLFPGLIRQATGDKLTELELTSKLYTDLSLYAFFSAKAALLVYALFYRVNIAERIGPSVALADAYASMCVVAGVIPVHWLARFYMRKAMAVADHIQQPLATAIVNARMAVYERGIGEQEKAATRAQMAAALAMSLGARNFADETIVNAVSAFYFMGNFSEMKREAEGLLASARQGNDLPHQEWGYGALEIANLYLNNLDASVEMGKQALALQNIATWYVSLIPRSGVLACAYFRQGKLDEAREMLERTLTMCEKAGRPTVNTIVEGYRAAAETSFGFWERAVPGSEEEAHWATASQKLIRHLRTYAQVFPVGQPYYLYFQGMADRLMNKPQRALSFWQRGLKEAEKLHMLYDQGLIHLELSRLDILAEAERTAHLQQARDLFTQCHTPHMLPND